MVLTLKIVRIYLETIKKVATLIETRDFKGQDYLNNLLVRSLRYFKSIRIVS